MVLYVPLWFLADLKALRSCYMQNRAGFINQRYLIPEEAKFAQKNISYRFLTSTQCMMPDHHEYLEMYVLAFLGLVWFVSVNL